MADGFEVDTDRLHTAAPKFAMASEDLTDALTQLQSVLAGCASMCGDDEQGREFAAGYDPAAATIAKSLSFAARGVRKVGTSVERIADNCDDLDDTNTRASRRTGGGG